MLCAVRYRIRVLPVGTNRSIAYRAASPRYQILLRLASSITPSRSSCLSSRRKIPTVLQPYYYCDCPLLLASSDQFSVLPRHWISHVLLFNGESRSSTCILSSKSRLVSDVLYSFFCFSHAVTSDWVNGFHAGAWFGSNPFAASIYISQWGRS